MRKWDYTVTAYCGANHPSPEKTPGEVLFQTVHKGTSSLTTEILALTTRLGRGEVDRIEIRKFK